MRQRLAARFDAYMAEHPHHFAVFCGLTLAPVAFGLLAAAEAALMLALAAVGYPPQPVTGRDLALLAGMNTLGAAYIGYDVYRTERDRLGGGEA